MKEAPASSPIRRRDAADAMRARLLETAARILASEGISGLTARRLSAAAGASTKVVYSHFGGMPGVIKALYDQGFAMLAEALANAVTRAERDDRLAAVANAYRGFASTHSDLFDLMYGPSVAVLLPTPAARENSRAALNVLITIFAGQAKDDAEDKARSFWAAIHGIIHLERTGWFDAEESERRLSEVIAQPWLEATGARC